MSEREKVLVCVCESELEREGESERERIFNPAIFHLSVKSFLKRKKTFRTKLSRKQ